jgi:hypothetical protein
MTHPPIFWEFNSSQRRDFSFSIEFGGGRGSGKEK